MDVSKIRESVAGYYRTNDPAHQLDHADDVYSLAVLVSERLGSPCDSVELAYAAYYHDTFSTDSKVAKEQRRNHHTLASELVMSSVEILDNVGYDGRIRVARAVAEHRASYKGKYFSMLSEIISTADRGLPNLEAMVTRSIGYARASKPNGDTAVDVYNHMVEKFGRSGYARYPDLYKKVFSMELEELYLSIDKLSVEWVSTFL